MFQRPPKELRFTQAEMQTMDTVEAGRDELNKRIKALEAALLEARDNVGKLTARHEKDCSRPDIELQSALRTNLNNQLIVVTNKYKNKEEYLLIVLKDVKMNIVKAGAIFTPHVDDQTLRFNKHFFQGAEWGVEVRIASSQREKLLKAFPVAEVEHKSELSLI